MGRWFNKYTKKPGTPPGTLIHVGERKVDTTRITLIDYDQQNFEERQVAGVEDVGPCKSSESVSWINVDGLHDVGLVEQLGRSFDLHPLVLEDILNTGQRPKFENHDQHLFFVVKMLRVDEETNTIQAEQVGLVLGASWVISFQEAPGDVFEAIRERLRQAKGQVRKMGADYLVYAILDAIVDHYFVVLERFSEHIESLEEEVIDDPATETIQQIYALKREMIFLRRSLWPLREAVAGFERSDSALVEKQTGIFLQDVYDHCVQAIDTAESFRDVVSGLLDIYLSSVSNRMNSVMKVLTIIATIFIPLTFIAGIYGMNFEYMPELKWKWAYFGVWGVMAAVALAMVFYFRRKRWL